MAIQRLLGLSAIMLSLCLSGEEQGAVTAPVAGPPSSVGVAAATLREVMPSMELVARVEAIDSVDLLAVVSSFLFPRALEEGATVKGGDLLIRIEPEHFETTDEPKKSS